MESQPQNPDFRINPETITHAYMLLFFKHACAATWYDKMIKFWPDSSSLNMRKISIRNVTSGQV